MKKLSYVFYLVLSIVLFSCGGNEQPQNQTEEPKEERLSVPFGITTIDYEGCEYIIYKDDQRSQVEMIHKQNCKHCERRQHDR